LGKLSPQLTQRRLLVEGRNNDRQFRISLIPTEC